jgi:CopG family nickel-responsive transcriptional regulator
MEDAMASDLVRFSVTMPEGLLEQLDAYVDRRGTRQNRSEVLRDLVRERLVDESLEVPDEEVIGSITMVYDHHTPGLSARLDKIQHRHHTEILSTMHVHLNHDDCLEILAVRGPGQLIANMADCLLGIKGVHYGRLCCVATHNEE